MEEPVFTWESSYVNKGKWEDSMITKLEELIESCREEAPKKDCRLCNCTKRECIICLIDEYNLTCDEADMIEDN